MTDKLQRVSVEVANGLFRSSLYVPQALFEQAEKERDEARAEVERLWAALTRLVELGDDDGSAPDDAWKQAFRQAADVLGSHKPCR